MPRTLLFLFALLATSVSAQAQSPSPPVKPIKILVHITHGPEAPTRAALAFNVAKAALDDGHQVTLFLVGDAVQLMREGTLDQLVGLGTGKLRELYDALAAGGVTFYLSRGSSQARGLTEGDLAGKKVQFGTAKDLVRLSAEHDRMFTY